MMTTPTADDNNPISDQRLSTKEADQPSTKMVNRFRGFLPVVIDVETGGFDARRDALLEISAAILSMDDDGTIGIAEQSSFHVEPFAGANLDPASLKVNGIDPHHPFRMALDEKEALGQLFQPIRQALRDQNCNRAVLVGHNAWFDLSFLNAAVARCGVKRNPFHPFTSFDTATLGGLAYGQTVLKRAVTAAGLDWSDDAAHSASYDTERTAALFCTIVNNYRELFPT